MTSTTSMVGEITQTIDTTTPGYTSWYDMKQRCNNPDNKSYDRYGGLGITYCEHWSLFHHFIEDMGERPEGSTLELINPNGNYELSNCRWIT